MRSRIRRIGLKRPRTCEFDLLCPSLFHRSFVPFPVYQFSCCHCVFSAHGAKEFALKERRNRLINRHRTQISSQWGTDRALARIGTAVNEAQFPEINPIQQSCVSTWRPFQATNRSMNRHSENDERNTLIANLFAVLSARLQQMEGWPSRVRARRSSSQPGGSLQIRSTL